MKLFIILVGGVVMGKSKYSRLSVRAVVVERKEVYRRRELE